MAHVFRMGFSVRFDLGAQLLIGLSQMNNINVDTFLQIAHEWFAFSNRINRIIQKLNPF